MALSFDCCLLDSNFSIFFSKEEEELKFGFDSERLEFQLSDNFTYTSNSILFDNLTHRISQVFCDIFAIIIEKSNVREKENWTENLLLNIHFLSIFYHQIQHTRIFSHQHQIRNRILISYGKIHSISSEYTKERGVGVEMEKYNIFLTWWRWTGIKVDLKKKNDDINILRDLRYYYRWNSQICDDPFLTSKVNPASLRWLLHNNTKTVKSAVIHLSFQS